MSKIDKSSKVRSGFIIVLVAVLAFVGGFFFQEWRFGLQIGSSTYEAVLRAFEICDEYSLYDFDKETLKAYMIYGISQGLGDEYATYVPPTSKEEYNDNKNGVMRGGIGVILQGEKNGEGFIVIQEVYDDNPAQKAGIKAGDIILEVDGIDVAGKTIDEVKEIVSSVEIGNTVRIRVSRGEDELVFDPVVSVVQKPMVNWQMLDGYAYIRIVTFQGNAATRFDTALEFAKTNNAKGLIIDLRDNGGGSTSIMQSIADRLLPEGVIMYALNKKGYRVLELTSDADCVSYPTVILTNGNSASASEAFAGALRDYGVAKIVGTKTYGKGIMQTTYTLPNGGLFKLTTAKYYLPNDECIHEVGITPEYIVEQDDWVSGMAFEDDLQLQKALTLLK